MIIHRNFSLSESDDYRLNVLSKINSKTAAEPVKDKRNQVVGWKISGVYV